MEKVSERKNKKGMQHSLQQLKTAFRMSTRLKKKTNFKKKKAADFSAAPHAYYNQIHETVFYYGSKMKLMAARQVNPYHPYRFYKSLLQMSRIPDL